MTVMNGEVGHESEARSSIVSIQSRGMQTLRRKDCDEWRGGTWIRSKEQYCFDSKSRNADSSQERRIHGSIDGSFIEQ